MLRNTKILCFLGFALIALLPGCARYSAQPLTRLMPVISKKTKDEQFISFTYHVFSKSDCKKFLDRDVISQGYQPIHIMIVNNTNRYFYISTTNFSFQCLDSQEVAQKVHTSTITRAASYGVAGIFIWPFLIPAIVDGIKSSEANRMLDIDFARKALHSQTIMPSGSANGLIFVPVNNFYEHFSLTITDQSNQEHFVLSSDQEIFKI